MKEILVGKIQLPFPDQLLLLHYYCMLLPEGCGG
jgi:hypothetical protein